MFQVVTRKRRLFFNKEAVNRKRDIKLLHSLNSWCNQVSWTALYVCTATIIHANATVQSRLQPRSLADVKKCEVSEGTCLLYLLYCSYFYFKKMHIATNFQG